MVDYQAVVEAINEIHDYTAYWERRFNAFESGGMYTGQASSEATSEVIRSARSTGTRIYKFRTHGELRICNTECGNIVLSSTDEENLYNGREIPQIDKLLRILEL